MKKIDKKLLFPVPVSHKLTVLQDWNFFRQVNRLLIVQKNILCTNASKLFFRNQQFLQKIYDTTKWVVSVEYFEKFWPHWNSMCSSNRNQSIYWLCKPGDWFLYDGNIDLNWFFFELKMMAHNCQMCCIRHNIMTSHYTIMMSWFKFWKVCQSTFVLNVFWSLFYICISSEIWKWNYLLTLLLVTVFWNFVISSKKFRVQKFGV